ncbi:hypothetical protein [Ktedonobacter robiniae]|uniref:Uncharacterized protein n=1 Tax=Ktedonobacter robiniae TaxID=2778365 RepID=A0ABQ3V6V2_9CHLR|nr:hypothetical protein [Ktedonobacter robiniae]GHO60688.1 hypothetical protein KSB_91630 [Ktedonobacter robiniae]
MPTWAKSGEPRTRLTSIPVEGGRIYVFAGNRGALTNPVVLQKKIKLIKIRVRFVEPGPVEDTCLVGVLDEEYKQQQVAATPGAPGTPGRRCPGRIVILIEAL